MSVDLDGDGDGDVADPTDASRHHVHSAIPANDPDFVDANAEFVCGLDINETTTRATPSPSSIDA